MTCHYRVSNFVLQLLTAVLEIVALWFLIQLLFSHCVLGEEYGISVWLYLFFLPGITLQSVMLFLFRLCCPTVGLDPIALLFNLASGIVCICTAVTLLLALVGHCGNEFAYMFYVSGSLGLIAGILHLINVGVCNAFMPISEWIYTKPSKKQRAKADKIRNRYRQGSGSYLN